MSLDKTYILTLFRFKISDFGGFYLNPNTQTFDNKTFTKTSKFWCDFLRGNTGLLVAIADPPPPIKSKRRKSHFFEFRRRFANRQYKTPLKYKDAPVCVYFNIFVI